MPAPFSPVTIPLLQGAREDLASLQTDDPSALAVAENVVFTRKGSVRGRPGSRTHTETAQTFRGAYPSIPTIGSITDAIAGLTPAGIITARSGTDNESPIALYQSRAWRLGTDNLWGDLGPFWSTRKSTSVDLGASQVTSVGNSLVAVSTATATARGAPYLDNGGAIEGIVSPLSLSASAGAICVGDVMFYGDGTDARIQIPGTFPAVTSAVIRAAASVVAACAGETGFAYVAVRVTATSNIEILRVSLTGSVTHAFTYLTAASLLTLVALAHNGTATLMIANSNPDGVTVNINSAIYAASSSGFTSAGLATTATSSNSAGYPTSLVAGIVNGTGYIASGAWPTSVATSSVPADNAAVSHLVLIYRELTTTVNGSTAIFGSWPGSCWAPLFQPVSFCGRPVMGIQRTAGPGYAVTGLTGNFTFYNQRFTTWAVVDITEAWTSKSLPIVAAGDPDACQYTPPATASVVNGAIRFAVNEGRTFDARGVASYSAVRVEIAPCGAAAAEANHTLLLSGGYVFDGRQLTRVGWFEAPWISAVVSPGGALSSGSYSLQAVYTYINGAGQTVRSPASNIATVDTLAAGKFLTVTVSVPQLHSRTIGLIEVYCTVVNPTGGADKYLVGTANVPVPATAGTTTVSVGLYADTDTTAQRLYTTGGVLDDDPQPSSDRGIATVGGRVWVAGQRKVQASKNLDARYGTAWSTTDLLQISIPDRLGDVRSIAALDDKLAVLCASGILVVTGPGYDDLGNGVGWATQVVSQVGAAGGPRSSCAIPQGVAFMGTDCEIYVLTRGLEVMCVSRPVRAETTGSTDSDVLYVAGANGTGDETTTNPLLIAGGAPLRVLDLEVGQWATWKTGVSS